MCIRILYMYMCDLLDDSGSSLFVRHPPCLQSGMEGGARSGSSTARSSGIEQPAVPLRKRLRKKTPSESCAPTVRTTACRAQNGRDAKRKAGGDMHPPGGAPKQKLQKREVGKANVCIGDRRPVAQAVAAPSSENRTACRGGKVRKRRVPILMLRPEWTKAVFERGKTWEIRG